MGGRASSFGKHGSGGAISLRDIKLKGTKKQIAWAEDIRKGMLKDYDDYSKLNDRLEALYKARKSNSSNKSNSHELSKVRTKLSNHVSGHRGTMGIPDAGILRSALEGQINVLSGKAHSIDDMRNVQLRRYRSEADKAKVNKYFDTISRQYKQAGGEKVRKAYKNYHTNKNRETHLEYKEQSNLVWYRFIKNRWHDRLKNNDATWWIDHRYKN